MKYIVEIKPEYEDSFKGVMILGAKDSNLFVDTLAVENLEELNSDYINEHYGDLQDTAYKRGVNDGSIDVKERVDGAYQRGLDDAWEAARKIADMWTRIDNDELLAIFEITERIGHSTIRAMFEKQTANEAMLELEAYEEKQKADNDIKVGDEVIYNGTTKCVVVAPETDEKYASLFDCNGIHYSADHCECKKTGNHYDIASILKEMQS